jgi:hypothetical protein
LRISLGAQRLFSSAPALEDVASTDRGSSAFRINADDGARQLVLRQRVR